MSRIRRGYEARFGALLREMGARRKEAGLAWLVARAQRLTAEEGIDEAEAFRRICEARSSCWRLAHANRPANHHGFYCDAGLGGLARWLRAAGHVALWEAGIPDDDLIRRARETATVILTTDSLLMERRLLRDGVLPSFWLPPALGIPAQLKAVFEEFGLEVGEPRCMSCGGELRTAGKESLRERIPPRTYRWLDSYFVCAKCDRLFWHGTHWTHIQRELRALPRAAAGDARRP